ncbi:Transposase mutator type [Methylorubrum populi]|uniref:Transposase mutator type n=1 Tax=Methylorubrum populi TaxID=223967 RepID=A0A833J527_9HYPH|nr:Transposase mutator type [Methylorubrum populi]
MIQEAYIQGISTRSVDDLVQAMGGTGVSKSQVSRLYLIGHRGALGFGVGRRNPTLPGNRR